MSKFMISMSDDPSKDEEIKVLHKLAENMPEGSYLAQLFTPDFVGWVQDRIRGDIFPDAFDYIAGP